MLTHCSSADDGSHLDAGWSSSVARWAHNPEVVGSNPAPATNFQTHQPFRLVGFFVFVVNATSGWGLGLAVEAPDNNNQSDDEAEKYQKAEPYQEEGEAGEER